MKSFKEFIEENFKGDKPKKQVKVGPTVSFVKSLQPKGWADYKHHLHRHGIIDSPNSDCPDEYANAFKKAFGR